MTGFLEKLDHIQNKWFGAEDPNAPKCCFCFPLKCGIIMIGVIAMIDCAQLVNTLTIFG